MARHTKTHDSTLVRSGADFDARVFPPSGESTKPNAQGLDPVALGSEVAREAIERLRSGTPRPPKAISIHTRRSTSQQ